MVTTFAEKISQLFWWGIASGITAYLFLGAVNTIVVILE
jgi:hypothetical protein